MPTDATSSTSHKDSSAATTEAETTKTVGGDHVTETLRHMPKHDKTIPTQPQAEQEDMLTSSSSLSDPESIPEVPFKM